MYKYINFKCIYNIIERSNFVYILKCIKIKNEITDQRVDTKTNTNI